nr:outer membrane beta-barrel protein [Chitinophagaceae bacterium]
TLMLQYNIRYNIQEKLNVSIGPSVSRNISESSLRPTANNNYWTYGGRANLYVKLPGGLDLDSDVQSNLRQKTSAFPNPVNITVWNASLGRSFFKNKNLRLSFVAHDILNQNIGFNRTINSNFVSEQRYDQLAQYFMFNIRWTFTKMPGMTKE